MSGFRYTVRAFDRATGEEFPATVAAAGEPVVWPSVLAVGDRVRGSYDSGTVRAIDGGLVLVEFDEVDEAGVRRPDPLQRTAWRHPWTLTKIQAPPEVLA